MSVENNMHSYLSPDFFPFVDSNQFVDTTGDHAAASPEDIFTILEALEQEVLSSDQLNGRDEISTSFFGTKFEGQEESTTTTTTTNAHAVTTKRELVTQKSTSSDAFVDLEESETEEVEVEEEAAIGGKKSCLRKSNKRQKIMSTPVGVEEDDGQQKISHIAVERNRRKQMNDNLSVLRSLMPSFYVKRGDQASIVGGVVDYITELQQVLQSLEAKKQRKQIYNEVLSPRVLPQHQQLISSPRLTCNSLPISPRKPPLSPRPLLPIITSLPSSPTTPQSTSPLYKNHHHYQTNLLFPYQLPYLSQTSMILNNPSLDPSPSSSSCSTSNSIDCANELVAHSKSAVAEVEVKFCGANVLLKTISPRVPGQAVKIIAALEHLSLEILNVNLKTVDELTMINSFTIKIGIECQLSAEELAQNIQQTFC